MGSGCRSCADRQGAQSSTGIGRDLLEGSGSNTAQHTRTLHAALERTHRPRSWLRTVARRSVGSRPRQINASQERTCCSERKSRMKSTETSPSAHVLKKSQPEEFDLVILGGGTGSTVAAWTFAGEGKRVAVVDRKYIGGSCPNIACLPSKNIIHSAKVVDYFRRGKEFGIAHDGFTIEMSGVRDRKRKMVAGLNEMYMENYRKTGAEFIIGTGRFVAPRTVEVALHDGSTRQLRGTNVIVSTGTRASLEPIPGLAEAQPLTHIEALELGQVPEHLLVIGGGYVGVEL